MNIADIEVTLIDHMGSDLSVVNAARVSFEKESELDAEGNLKQEDVRLINYLAANKHTSPFNHTFITVRVKAPIFVARQLVKHKFMPWNEVSRRYVDSEPEFYVPEAWRAKAENVKQGSGDVLDKTYLHQIQVEQYVEDADMFYCYLLSQGVCPEQARMVLPQNTMTEWIWSGTLGAFADMCRLRLDSHTQAETRIVAQKISGLIAPLYPYSWGALIRFGK